MKNIKIIGFVILIVVIILLSIGRLKGRYERMRNDYKDLPTLERDTSSIVITKHAKCRMECRDITLGEIKQILLGGKIDQKRSNVNDERGPEYALEGYSNEGQHIRIIVSTRNYKTILISCIDLDKEWKCDCN